MVRKLLCHNFNKKINQNQVSQTLCNGQLHGTLFQEHYDNQQARTVFSTLLWVPTEAPGRALSLTLTLTLFLTLTVYYLIAGMRMPS